MDRVIISEEAQIRARLLDELEEEKARLLAQKKAKDSDYKDWVQVNRITSKKLIAVGRECPAALSIWNFFNAYMDGYNAIMVSYSAMIEILGLSRATVSRAIDILKSRNLLDTYKSGTSNVYVLNPGAVWSRWSKEKKYCRFSASVIVTLSEQDKATQEIIQNRLNRISTEEEQK